NSDPKLMADTQKISWKKAIEMVDHDEAYGLASKRKLWDMRKKKTKQNKQFFATPRPMYTSLPVQDIKGSLLWIASARDRIRSQTDDEKDSHDDDDMFSPENAAPIRVCSM
ncbi:hypothetical protein EC968_002145, partial [Mortierella alpina]